MYFRKLYRERERGRKRESQFLPPEINRGPNIHRRRCRKTHVKWCFQWGQIGRLTWAFHWTFLSFCRTEKKNSCRIFHKEVRWRKDFLKRSGEMPSVRDKRQVRGKKRINSSCTSIDSTWTWTLSLRDLGRARGCYKAATARLHVHCWRLVRYVARAEGKWLWSREVFLPLTRFVITGVTSSSFRTCRTFGNKSSCPETLFSVFFGVRPPPPPLWMMMIFINT